MSRACPECGKSYDSNVHLGRHMGSEHGGKPWIKEENIRELYHGEGMSQREVADELDTSKRMIQKAMEWYEIPRRKSYRDDYYPPRHRFTKISDSVGHEYEIVEASHDYESKTALIHRLVAVAKGELDPSEFGNFQKVVHHKSEHGLDNRPENLTVMDRGEHQSMHVIERYHGE